MQYAHMALQVARDIISDKQYSDVENIQKKLQKVSKVIMANHNLEFTIENVFRKIIAEIKAVMHPRRENKGIERYSKLKKLEFSNLPIMMTGFGGLQRQCSSIESSSLRELPSPVLSQKNS